MFLRKVPDKGFGLRVVATLLAFGLALPSFALALRDPEAREKKPEVLSGLEEALRDDSSRPVPWAASPAAIFPGSFSGMEERVSDFSMERAVMLADKFLTRSSSAVIDADSGLFGMADPRVASVRRRVKTLLRQEVPTRAIHISGPEEQSFDLDLSALWAVITGRRSVMTFTIPSGGSMTIGPAQLVLVETAGRPFLAAELKTPSLENGFYYTISQEPVPEDIYRIVVELARAHQGSHEFQIYLPRVLLETGGPLSESGLTNLILSEAAIEIARMVFGSFRAIPLGIESEETGTFRQAQETTLAQRLRKPGLAQPTELGLSPVRTQSSGQIADFFDILDFLAQAYAAGDIVVAHRLEGYVPTLLNALAGAAVRNRIPLAMLRAMLTAPNWLEYSRVDADTRAEFSPPAAENRAAEVLIPRTRLPGSPVATADRERFLENPWVGRQLKGGLSGRTETELDDLYRFAHLCGSLKSEHAHFLDHGVMAILNIVDTSKRKRLGEYADVLEHLVGSWNRFAQSAPLSPEQVADAQEEIQQRDAPKPNEWWKHRLAHEMLGRVLPILLDRVSTQALPGRDLVQSLVWFKLLLLVSEDPDEVESLVTSAPSIDTFFSSAAVWLRGRMRELVQKGAASGPRPAAMFPGWNRLVARMLGLKTSAPAPAAAVVYLQGLLRDLEWTRTYLAAHRQLPPRGEAAGLEELLPEEGPSTAEEQQVAFATTRELVDGYRSAVETPEAAVIGGSLASRFPGLQVLAGMEEQVLIDRDDPADMAIRLAERGMAHVQYFGGLEEAGRFAAVARPLGIGVTVRSLENPGFGFLLREILLAIGVPEVLLASGLEELDRSLTELGQAA